MKEEYHEYKKERETLCMEQLEECKKNKTQNWTVEDVTFVLKGLKTGKSQDPYEMPNEIFKPGDDLIKALTILMNGIKNEFIFPSTLEKCNVTNLYKK